MLLNPIGIGMAEDAIDVNHFRKQGCEVNVWRKLLIARLLSKLFPYRSIA